MKDFKTVVFHNDWNKIEDTQQEDQNNHKKLQKLNKRKNISINQGCTDCEILGYKNLAAIQCQY